MVAGFLDVVRHQVLERQHPLHIQVAGAGDQVLLVGIFPGQLITNKMTAVVEVLAVHKVVLDSLPAGGFYLADAAPLLSGHEICAHIGIGRDRSGPEGPGGCIVQRTLW